jgi:chromosome segregation ATPase
MSRRRELLAAIKSQRRVLKALRQSLAKLQGQIDEAVEALNTAQADLAELEQEMDRRPADLKTPMWGAAGLSRAPEVEAARHPSGKDRDVSRR